MKGNKIFFSDLEPYRVFFFPFLVLILGLLLVELGMMVVDPYIGSVDYDTTRTFRDPITSIFRAIPAILSTPLGGVLNIFHSPRRGAVKTTWGFIDGKSHHHRIDIDIDSAFHMRGL